MSSTVATTYRLVLPGRPFTTNIHMRAEKYQRAALDAEWRLLAAVVARHAKVPRFDAIAVTVQSELVGRRSRDVGSDASCAKACIDGLRDAHVIEDDTPAHLRSVTFLAPLLGAERDALVLTIGDA